MRGEPIQAVNVGLRAMLNALRQDPHALESVYICIITFDADVRVVLPLTALDEVTVPEIRTPDSGPTHLGRGLDVLCQRVDREVLRTSPDRKGDWMPLLFVMTDGSPSDRQLYETMIPEVKKRGFANIVGCAAGPRARGDALNLLADHVVSLDTTDSATFTQFFQWVSTAVAIGNRSVGKTTKVMLPPAPPEIQVVF